MVMERRLRGSDDDAESGSEGVANGLPAASDPLSLHRRAMGRILLCGNR